MCFTLRLHTYAVPPRCDLTQALDRMFKYAAPVTPAEVSSALRSLVNDLVPGGSAVYVDMEPLRDALADECFYIVEAQCKEHGGRSVTGWALWELPTLFVEAEFRCVWERPDGTLVDITPKNSETASSPGKAKGRTRESSERLNLTPPPGARVALTRATNDAVAVDEP